MSVFDAVFFDLDGTLTDTEKYYQMTWPAALEHFGYHASPEMVLEMRSLSRPFAIARFKEWFGEEAGYDEIREYRKSMTDALFEDREIPLKPGAVELLCRLKEEGITSALVTAQHIERAKKNLEKTGLDRYLSRVIAADMVKLGKPAPDIYLFACRELGIRPERALAVEDSPNGVKSAYGAGCKVVMIPDLTEPDEELTQMLYARADKLTDIIGLLY